MHTSCGGRAVITASNLTRLVRCQAITTQNFACADCMKQLISSDMQEDD